MPERSVRPRDLPRGARAPDRAPGAQTVAQICRASSRFVYADHPLPPRAGEPARRSRPTSRPTRRTSRCLTKDFLRCLFVLEGFRRRAGPRGADGLGRQGPRARLRARTRDRTGRRILLVLNHSGYFGVFRGSSRSSPTAGTRSHVAFLSGTAEDRELSERAAADTGVTWGRAPKRAMLDGWSSVAWLARALGDLGRYSDPRFAESPALRERMAAKVESHLTGRPASIRHPALALRRARSSTRPPTPSTGRALGPQGARLESGDPGQPPRSPSSSARRTRTSSSSRR